MAFTIETVKPAYIKGIDTHKSTTDATWGPVEGGSVINTYAPKNAYINSILNTITAGPKRAYIHSPGIVMRLTTLDGNIDLNTLALDDSSAVNNDGIIINMPEWIAGPHG